MADIRIVDLGGSIVVPDKVDTAFLKEFRDFITNWLREKDDRKLVFIIGGGAPARTYQKAFTEMNSGADSYDLDQIGIAATRLNAQFVKAVFGELCSDPLVTDPSGAVPFTGRILVAGGWKPGFSTDYVSVVLAGKFRAEIVYNLSNIVKVFTADPKKDPEARPLDRITWDTYKKMCGDKWIPGFNTPFDPVATARAAEAGMKVMVASGRDIPNLKKLFNGEPFTGTVMEP